jgi:solute carrier family 25 thiamine pyrophosphate transporter 19
LKQALGNVSLPFAWLGSGDGLSGILASITSKTVVYPLDTVRKRLQVQGPNRARFLQRNIPEYTSGVFGTIAVVLQREGIRGIYRGLSVSLMKAAPTSAVTMWTYERVMAALRYADGDSL